MKKLEKKVLIIQGNVMEIGQSLTNLIAANQDFTIMHSFTGNSVRERKSSILGSQPQYEPVTILFLIYTNPGDLKGVEFNQVAPPGEIKGSLKKLPN